MRVTRGFVLALGVPAFFILTALSTFADATPSPSGSPSGAAALPGDPTKGAQLYAQNCTTCHGSGLEGGIGATLNPIDKLPGVANPLDPTFLIAIITNARQPQPGDPKNSPMPPKAVHGSLPAPDVNNSAGYILV